jgi:hypothetical protein
MKVKLTCELEAGPSAPESDPGIIEIDGKRIWQVGAIIEGPDAYLLAHGGCAECVDDECREAVNACKRPQGQLRANHIRLENEREDYIAELEAEEEDEE